MAITSRLFGHLIDCRHATRLISQLQDRELRSWERARLRLHLAVCDACSRFEQQVAFMRDALRRFRT
ncbi:MAG TPA: zf-HC2 domain-containing protein [Casimicrobiaceae bacterium]|nr:zf-HC2 domain-containing protein [Casimicrobiaceae bacterium]